MKKGHFTIPVVVILILIALAYAWIALSAKYGGPSNLSYRIGMKQSAVIRSYIDAQKAQLYLDVATPYALAYATQSLAKTGGFYRDPEASTPCGNYMYSLWNNEEQNCFPAPQHALAQYLNDELAPFLQEHNSLRSLHDPFRTLTFTNIDNGVHVHALAVEPIEFVISTGNEPEVTMGENACPGDDQVVPIDSRIVCKQTGGNCQLLREASDLLTIAYDDLRTTGINGNTYELQVTSAYRSLEKQQQLWNKYCSHKTRKTCKRVAWPSCSAPHLTGGAFDLSIPGLDLGPYVVQGPGVFTPAQLENQQLLCEFMFRHGFVRYEREWWHFEHGTTRWERGVEQNTCKII